MVVAERRADILDQWLDTFKTYVKFSNLSIRRKAKNLKMHVCKIIKISIQKINFLVPYKSSTF